MAKAKKNPYYAVKVGRRPGVYIKWDDCKRQVDGFPGNMYKSFATEAEANAYIMTANRALPAPTVQQLRAQIPAVPQLLEEPISTVGPALNAEQQIVLDKVIAGKNVFFTGSAGTGKSVLLRAIIEAFKQRHHEAHLTGGDPDRWTLGVAASTGMAGVNIGGTTIHSWAFVGLFGHKIEAAVGMIRAKPSALERWTKSKALMIDEVSMISGLQLDYLDIIGQKLRNNKAPFGGLQVILSGDFYQLPPVGNPCVFAFQARCWHSLIPVEDQHDLTRVYRQTDNTFVRLLEKMRYGQVDEVDVDTFKALSRPLVFEDGIEPVGLYATRAEVQKINQERLLALREPLTTFSAHDVPGRTSEGRQLGLDEAVKKLDSYVRFPRTIDVCVGALVMLAKNMPDDELVNGSTGRIVGFETLEKAHQTGIQMPRSKYNLSPLATSESIFPIIEFAPSKYGKVKTTRTFMMPAMSVDVMNANQEAEATRFQVPLILAWALTIHKSQGQTLERVKVDLGRVFEKGQSYVALSRAVDMDGLELHNFHPDRVLAHHEVREWDRQRRAAKTLNAEWDNAE